MDLLIWALFGYIVGAGFCTLYDFMFKMISNPDLAFDRRYLVTMLISTILSLMSAAVTFSTVTIPEGSTTAVFIWTLAQGFMVNHLINKPLALLSKTRE